MAELIRDALRAYLGSGSGKAPPGAGAFRSGRRDTAGQAEKVLARTGFGADRSLPRRHAPVGARGAGRAPVRRADQGRGRRRVASRLAAGAGFGSTRTGSR